MLSVTIDRKQWARACGGSLWSHAGNCGCVLGHVALALGSTKDQIMGKATSSAVRKAYPELHQPVVIAYNDAQRDDSAIEADLTAYFSKYNIALTFTGKGHPFYSEPTNV